MKRLGLIVGIIAILAGCVRPQKEEPRAVAIDPHDLGLAGPASPRPDDGWWHAFGDSQLDRLVDAALEHNPTLAEALARVRGADAQVQEASAGLKPSISLDADETYQRFSENYYIPPPYAGGKYWAGQTGLNLGWTLDFWGRQAALIRQAKAGRAASELDRVSARLALSGSIAQAYLDLFRAYALSDVATRTLEQRARLLKLTRERVASGLDTAVETKIAEARVFEARNALTQSASARDLAVHRLAALAGRGADYYSQIVRPQLQFGVTLPIPDALPIDLLARRPDVLAARARIDAAGSARDAAHAAFYPTVNLKAFAGFQAIGLDNLFQGGSAIFGVGPTLHLPIFEAQRLRAGYRSATASLDAAIAGYNDTVLNAVRQTADQLSLGVSLATQIGAAREGLAAAQAAHDMAERRYASGIATQLNVLNAETEVLTARRSIVGLEADLAIARVTLLLTLGGSFNPQTANRSTAGGTT